MSDSIQSSLPGAGELNARAPMPLAEALRALPLAAPPESAWPRLAASLAQQVAHPRGANAARARRRYLLPAALAAAVAAAFVATASLRVGHVANGRLQVAGGATATKLQTGASSIHDVANDANRTDAESLAAAQARSHALERWLRETGKDSAPQSAQDIAASAEIEDMIGMVDIELADRSEDNASLPLWRRRIALLEDLATLRYGANLDQFKSGLLASETNDARRATWNN